MKEENIMKFELTKKEQNAIKSLKKLAKKWPKTLWLFSASGTLCVMRTGDFGKQVFHGKGGSVDPEYIVTTISNINNDGGDW